MSERDDHTESEIRRILDLAGPPIDVQGGRRFWPGYTVTESVVDSISRSCTLQHPDGRGVHCHTDHFTYDRDHPCTCEHLPAAWAITHPGIPVPDTGYHPEPLPADPVDTLPPRDGPTRTMIVHHISVLPDGSVPVDTMIVDVPPWDSPDLRPCDRFALMMGNHDRELNAVPIAMTILSDHPKPGIVICGTRTGTRVDNDTDSWSHVGTLPESGGPPEFAWITTRESTNHLTHEPCTSIQLIASSTTPDRDLSGWTPLRLQGDHYAPIEESIPESDPGGDDPE